MLGNLFRSIGVQWRRFVRLVAWSVRRAIRLAFGLLRSLLVGRARRPPAAEESAAGESAAEGQSPETPGEE